MSVPATLTAAGLSSSPRTTARRWILVFVLLLAAILNSATKIGAALGILIAGLLIAAYGWRTMFYVLGGVGVAFLVLWFMFAPEPERTGREKSTTGEEPSLWDILSNRDAWGTF